MTAAVLKLPPQPRLSRAAAAAELSFVRDAGGVTRLGAQRLAYPLHVTRALYLDAAAPGFATLYLQSASGGLFQDDRFSLEIDVGPGGAAHVTAQSATKVHSMPRGEAQMSATLHVAEGALLEYVSDPLILFPDSRVRMRTHLELAQGAKAILADGALWHDPAGALEPRFALLDLDLVVSERGRARLRDRQRASGAQLREDGGWTAPGVLGGRRGFGSVFAFGGDGAALADAMNTALADVEGAYAGASVLADGFGACARVVAADGLALRRALDAAWRAAHRALAGWPIATRRK